MPLALVTVLAGIAVVVAFLVDRPQRSSTNQTVTNTALVDPMDTTTEMVFPDDFPDDIPRYQDGVIVSVTQRTRRLPYDVIIVTDDDMVRVRDTLSRDFVSRGWDITVSEDETQNMFLVDATKSGRTASATIGRVAVDSSDGYGSEIHLIGTPENEQQDDIGIPTVVD